MTEFEKDYSEMKFQEMKTKVFGESYKVIFYFSNGHTEYFIMGAKRLRSFYKKLNDRQIRFLMFDDGIGLIRINLDLVYKVDAEVFNNA